MDLDWPQITSLVIKYGSNNDDDSFVYGFEFYNSENKLIHKIGGLGGRPFKVNLRKGDRVVGIKAHNDGNFYHNLQLIIIGP